MSMILQFLRSKTTSGICQRALRLPDSYKTAIIESTTLRYDGKGEYTTNEPALRSSSSSSTSTSSSAAPSMPSLPALASYASNVSERRLWCVCVHVYKRSIFAVAKMHTVCDDDCENPNIELTFEASCRDNLRASTKKQTFQTKKNRVHNNAKLKKTKKPLNGAASVVAQHEQASLDVLVEHTCVAAVVVSCRY